MKNIIIIIIFLILGCSPILSFAVDADKIESSVRSFDDYVKIRYMPSRSNFLKQEPVTELKSESHTIVILRDGKVMDTNAFIKQIFDQAKLLNDKGITSNQRFFHVSIKTIEVSYMGKIISLEYTSKSNAEEYLQYEKEWLKLYDLVYPYLTKDISP